MSDTAQPEKMVAQPGRGATSFHLFLSLPQELQDLIWEWVRAQPPIYHHHLFGVPGALVLTSIDTCKSADERYTNAVLQDSQHEDNTPVDPMEMIICLKRRTMATVGSKLINNILKTHLTGRVHWSRGSIISCFLASFQDCHFQEKRLIVNVEKDFIVVSPYLLPGQSGQSGFNILNLNWPTDNWPLRIRRLALRVTNASSLDSVDRRDFQKLTNLRTVILLIHIARLDGSNRPDLPDKWHGFTKWDAFSKWCDTAEFRLDPNDQFVLNAKALQLDMQDYFRRFKKQGIRPVEVELAVDKWLN
ncbi:hypothetical protein F5Y18DRAFT_436822 [Xylariaceae sp. FL1019]|nr:hypothetical protein F5Y18DRAFT_436822 [Xylariaceae sp. FL1019]